MGQVKDKKKARKAGAKTMAKRADLHDLYQAAVQSTEFEIEFYEKRYRELRGKNKTPLTLREDFCGTALLATDWCKSNPKREAIGIDLCSDTLKWGMENNLKPAGADVQSRVTLINENVLDVVTNEMDMICAMNFSYCIFKSRDLLRSYFVNVHQGLKKDGLFFMDLLGGTCTTDVCEEERDLEGWDASYVWEQTSYNPINHDLQCYIHFLFNDGSKLKKAFSYDWRLWSIPEIEEILYESGFSKVHIYWEEFKDNGDPDDEYLEGTGRYRAVRKISQQESWLAYFVVEK